MMQKTGPDSLMGWLVALMICFIATMMYGTAGLSSMMFVACITRYDTDRNQASFPFILSYVIQATTGPFGGYFANKFGVRAVVLAGSILACIGIGTCFFAESIMTVTILWGIIFGMGFGFSTLLLPAIINDYFFKHRSKALGMSYLGSPIGFFVFPPIFEVLFNEYGLSGTFLFLAAINMHCIPLSLLLKRPNFKEGNKKIPEEIEAANTTKFDGKNARMNNQKQWFVYENSLMKEQKVKSNIHQRRYSVEFLWEKSISQELPSENGKQYILALNKNSLSSKLPNSKARSYENINNNMYEHLDSPPFKRKKYFVPRFLVRDSKSDDLVSKISRSIYKHLDSDEKLNKFHGNQLKNSYRFSNITQKKESTNILGKALDMKDIMNDSYQKICYLNEKNNYKEFSVIYYGIVGDHSSPKYDSNFTAKDDVECNESYVNKGFSYSLEQICYSNNSCDTFKNLPLTQEVNIVSSDYHKDTYQSISAEECKTVPPTTCQNQSLVRMYCSPTFILLAIVNAIFNLQFNTLTTVIIDFSRDHNIDFSYEKFIMMCLSIMGTCGLLGFGWITDGGYMARNKFASLCQFITSISTALLPLTVGFETLIAALSAWCIFQSCFVLLLPAIVAEYFEDDLQAVAVSAVNVLCGPLYLIIPPLIGYFRDGKGTYDDIFFLLSGLSLLNSIAVFVVPYVARWKQKPCKS